MKIENLETATRLVAELKEIQGYLDNCVNERERALKGSVNPEVSLRVQGMNHYLSNEGKVGHIMLEALISLYSLRKQQLEKSISAL